MNHKLSSQAIGAIMMALQKSLIGQTDIVPILQGFEVQIDDSGQLVVMNPPSFEVAKSEVDIELKKVNIETSVQ
jgi:hypothetical protein